MRPILALNCLLQIEQERSEEESSVGDALALAFRCACFCSASLILFASYSPALLFMRPCHFVRSCAIYSLDSVVCAVNWIIVRERSALSHPDLAGSRGKTVSGHMELSPDAVDDRDFFRNTIRVSNSLDPDQDRYFVGPDLGPNCLQMLAADDKSPLAGKE